MKKFFRFSALVIVSITPFAALAQAGYSGVNINAITPYSQGIIDLINHILVPVLMAIAFITFLWGAFKYFIWNAENEMEKAEGRKFALWGIIGFVVILALWGLVNLLMSVLGLTVGQAPRYPTIGGGSTSGQSAQTTLLPSAGSYGSSVYQNGTLIGRVNTSGEIVDSNGRVIGYVRNGQPVYSSGVAIPDSTVGSINFSDYRGCIDAGNPASLCAETFPDTVPTGGTSAGSGCTDRNATNYDASAETNDGSCTYSSGGGSSSSGGGQTVTCADGTEVSDASQCVGGF